MITTLFLGFVALRAAVVVALSARYPKDAANEQSEGEHFLNWEPRHPSAPHRLTFKRNR
jgi:hypothetical protein